MSPAYTIKVIANPRKLFPGYITQVRQEHVLADGATESLAGIGSDPAERPVRGESPEVPAADAERGAAIAVTVTGQRLNTGGHL